MAQHKNIFSTRHLWSFLGIASTLLTLAACGNRSGSKARFDFNNARNLQSPLDGTFPGQLPTNASSPQYASGPQSDGNMNGGALPNSPNSFNSINLPNSEDGRLIIGQTANDFGLLNYCYNQILDRGKTLLNTGSTADYVFKAAGQELFRCYNEVIQRRASELQAYQAYQKEQQLRDYWNAYYQAVLQAQLRGNYSGIQVSLPPSGKKAGGKK